MKPFPLSRRQAIARMGYLASTTLAAAGAAPSAFGATPPAATDEKGPLSQSPNPVSELEAEPKVSGRTAPETGSEVLARFSLNDQHIRFTQVILQDETDSHNELVQTREWLLHPAEGVEAQGNLFVFENVLTGEGRVLVKLEPLPHARPSRTPTDIQISPRARTGFDVVLLGSSGGRAGSPEAFVELPYAGGMAGRTRALQKFQRSHQPRNPAHRTPRFLSNTWGDRSRDSRINHQFIEKEIEAGARLGVEVVQIDDGWQTGISGNSARAAGHGAWSGFWQAQSDFWQPDPKKFPGGLKPLAGLAAARGLELGLWFAPDSLDDFANWGKDAACLVKLHKEVGVRYFKIDGVCASSAAAFANLNRFFSRVLRETGEEAVFDLDITASLRPGYFGALGIGPLFLENRYTDSHRYWPHQTLRNLWQLAWWVDPGRLRMEFLNHARRTEKYPADPLAPVRYAPATLFATVFFSNPLAWFEVSNLPTAYFEHVAPLVKTWKQVRAELFAGTILPLGQAPDGVAWTGFASVADDGQSALALVFRELNPSPFWELTIPGFTPRGAVRCEILAGAGTAEWGARGLTLERIAPLGWLLVRISS